jgi:hypothetical protein
VALLDAAVADPGGAGDPGGPLLAGGVEVERGLQQQPLQLPALVPDRLLPVPVIEVPGLLRRPGCQARELLRRGVQRRRQLLLQRDLGPVLQDPPHRHREFRRHRRASRYPQEMIPGHHPGNGPGTRRTSGRTPSRPCLAFTTRTMPEQHE